jgi:hypothetical protein
VTAARESIMLLCGKSNYYLAEFLISSTTALPLIFAKLIPIPSAIYHFQTTTQKINATKRKIMILGVFFLYFEINFLLE